MIRQSVMAAALVLGCASASWANGPLRDRLGVGEERARDRAVESPEHFRDWAEGRLESLREDFDALDRRLDGYAEDRREKSRVRLSELKERVSRAEGRLEEVSDERNKQAWKTRENIREEIKDVREDFQDIRGDLRKK